jgi:hypothetical protein
LIRKKENFEVKKYDLTCFSYTLPQLSFLIYLIYYHQPPPKFYDNIVYDYTANSITLISQLFGLRGMISVFSYIDLSQNPGIPDYDPLILLMISAISIIGVISIYRKKLIH